MIHNIITVYHIYVVPDPAVNVIVPNNQIVGQSLNLECIATTVRGITSRVDIMWRRGHNIVSSNRVSTTTTMNNLLVYNDSYTISQLNTSDDGIMYECRLVIHANPRIRVTDSVSLDVTGKYFIETGCKYKAMQCLCHSI